MIIRSTAFLLPVMLGAGCAPAPAPSPALPPQSPACLALAARVTAHPDSFNIQPPELRQFPVPPLDHPASVVGKTYRIRMFVDASGRVVRDSISFTPEVVPRSFRRDFVAVVAEYKFRPAMVDGCAVADTAATIASYRERP